MSIVLNRNHPNETEKRIHEVCRHVEDTVNTNIKFKQIVFDPDVLSDTFASMVDLYLSCMPEIIDELEVVASHIGLTTIDIRIRVVAVVSNKPITYIFEAKLTK